MIRYCWLFDNFKTLSSKIRNNNVLCSSNQKKMLICFAIISKLTASTRVFVSNVKAGLFLQGTFIKEQRIQFAWYWKKTLHLQIFKLLFIELTKRVLNCNYFFATKKRDANQFLLRSFHCYFLLCKNFL